MKIRKTLVIMFRNPTRIFLYFLFCWLLFSALTTIADDPFQYGTLPDAADEIKEVGEGLPLVIMEAMYSIDTHNRGNCQRLVV